MPFQPMDLSGRCILVTGASSGIGRETARYLSRLNARMVLVGRNEERLRQTLDSLEGAGHEMCVFDLSEIEEIPRWLKSVAARTGPFGGLVHSAGVVLTLPIRSMSVAKLDLTMRVNFYAAYLLCKGLYQRDCYEPGASIVMVSSVAGMHGDAGKTAYSASKAALEGLCRSLAIELVRDKVRVNCVAPAMVRTEVLEQARSLLTDEQIAAIEKVHPMGFGTPADVAGAIAFLLADTGKWITGTTLIVDGGFSAR
jgi:NAD(P)-dependent dehydrogenase (short-subunit alcohol dehydrogenase family)